MFRRKNRRHRHTRMKDETVSQAAELVTSQEVTVKPSVKQFSQFHVAGWIGEGNYTCHPVVLDKNAKKENSLPSSWVMKQSKPGAKNNIYAEVVAQEFMRLLLPWQPKTQIVETGAQGARYVISQKITDFMPLSKVENPLDYMLKGNQYRGLGPILVCALLVNETDIHYDNIGINESGQIIKIDGDRCFVMLRYDDVRDEITAKCIRELPYISDYWAGNWLDLYCKNQHHRRNWADELQKNPEFRRSIYLTALKAILLSDDLLFKFVSVCAHDQAETGVRLHAILRERISQLKVSMLEVNEFRDYLASEVADKDIKDYWADLESFCMPGKNNLVKLASFDQAQLVARLETLRNEGLLLGFQSNETIAQFKLPIFKTVDNVLEGMTRLAITQDIRSKVCAADQRLAVDFFLEALHQFLKTRKLNLFERDSIINHARQLNLGCFELIYKKVSVMSGEKKLLEPLGFYRELDIEITYFRLAQDEEKIIEHANRIEAILRLHANYFINPKRYKPNDNIRQPWLLPDIAAHIKWQHGLRGFGMTKDLCPLAEKNENVRRVLFRLGFPLDMQIVSRLPIEFVSSVMDQKLCFFDVFVLIYKSQALASQLINDDFFFKYLYVKLQFDSGDAELKDVEAIEKFIASHMPELAFSDVNSSAGNYLKNQIQQLIALKEHAVSVNQFLEKFFQDSGYPYGIYAILRTRMELSPVMFDTQNEKSEEDKREMFGRKIFVSNNQNSSSYFNDSFLYKREFDTSPLMSLLLLAVPSSISLRSMFVVMDMHFSVERLPLSVLLGALNKYSAMQGIYKAKLIEHHLYACLNGEIVPPYLLNHLAAKINKYLGVVNPQVKPDSDKQDSDCSDTNESNLSSSAISNALLGYSP